MSRSTLGRRTIDIADAEILALQREAERSAALADELGSALPVAIEAERVEAEAEVRRIAEGHSAEYGRLAREDYLPVAETVAEILSEMQLVAVAFARANERLTSGRRLPPLETFRGVPTGGQHVPPIFEAAKLPAVDYGEAPVWDAVDAAWRRQIANEPARREREAARELARFAAQQPVQSRPAIVQDGRIDAAGIRMQRPDEAVWFGEREERLAAEEAAERANSSVQSKRIGGAS